MLGCLLTGLRSACGTLDFLAYGRRVIWLMLVLYVLVVSNPAHNLYVMNLVCWRGRSWSLLQAATAAHFVEVRSRYIAGALIGERACQNRVRFF